MVSYSVIARSKGPQRQDSVAGIRNDGLNTGYQVCQANFAEIGSDASQFPSRPYQEECLRGA